VDLAQWIDKTGKLPVADAVGWTLRLARALEVLHGRARAHGRICPQALVTGAAGRREPAMLLEPSRLPVLPGYHSVDRTLGKPPSPADDVWAAGVTLYYALTGALPFRGDTDDKVKERIEWAPPKSLAQHGCDARRVQRVLDRLFAPYRSDRIITAHDLEVVLLRCLDDKERLIPIDVPDSTVMASHHLVKEKSRATVEEPSIEIRPTAPPTGAEVLDAWLDDQETGESAEPAEIARWLHDDEAPSTGRVVAELIADVERDSEHEPTPELPRQRQVQRAAQPPSVPLVAARTDELAHEPATQRVPQAPRRRKPLRPWLPWRAAAVGAALRYAAFGPDGQPPVAPSASPQPSAPASAPSVASLPSAAPSASVAAGPSARDRCMAKLFPRNTFTGDPPSFDGACHATDPREGAQSIKTLVVEAGEGRGITDGMVEWSRLGWYEMAAFAILHGRCCDTSLELEGKPFSLCEVGDALERVHEASRTKDRRQVGKSVDVYRRAARCAARGGMSGLFGQTARPTPQQLEVLQKTMTRL
jgi:hypothetical protein